MDATYGAYVAAENNTFDNANNIPNNVNNKKNPTRSKAAYPPPRWVFGYLLIECGAKVLNCGALGIENIDFSCSGDRKY